MTVVEDREPTLARDLGLTLVLLAVLFGAVGVVGLRVLDRWHHRDDLGVDFDPEQPAVDVTQRFFRLRNPSETRFTAHLDSHLVVDAADGTVLTDLGADVDEVAWVDDDRLIAFGQSNGGGFEGLAVVDLADRSVDQVDRNGHSGHGYHPVRLTDDGDLLVCEWLRPDPSGTATCGKHFLLDPDIAELKPV